MAAEDIRIQAEGAAYAAHLILEEEAERLHNLEVHLLWKSAHVVVALDGGRRALDRAGLDHVRVDCTLSQPTRILDSLGNGIEFLHEILTDGLALLFRIRHTLEVREEAVGRLHTLDIQAHTLV